MTGIMLIPKEFFLRYLFSDRNQAFSNSIWHNSSPLTLSINVICRPSDHLCLLLRRDPNNVRLLNYFY